MTQDIATLELQYHQITTFYDLAEELVGTVEHEHVSDQEAQMTLVEPLVQQLSDGADVLCEAFITVAGEGQQEAAHKMRIESSLRKIYTVLDGYYERLRDTVEAGSTALRNVADPIVERVKYQLELVISTLVDYIDLSLERIMQKQYIDEMRKRQEKIAQMLRDTERRTMEVGT